MSKVTLINSDVLAGLRQFPDHHFDSCVTDPPYELGFMGKIWDSSGISYSVEMWKEVLRVMKPGAHLLAFGGSRTYHRMVCAIEDAGFQIRDQIMWLYGSGFPKSLDVSKGIDKASGSYKPGEVLPTSRQVEGPGGYHMKEKRGANPQSGLAHQWEGWGTALKPAHEPIVVARKPLEGTVVANMLKHGTGAINVAGCRIEYQGEADIAQAEGKSKVTVNRNQEACKGHIFPKGEVQNNFDRNAGRWPANVIHDGSDEVLACFPKQTSQTGNRRNKNRIQQEAQATPFTRGQYAPEYTDGGSPARFFYTAKASQEERNAGLHAVAPQKRDESRKEGNPGGDNPRNRGVKPVKNNHPTVKPLALMCYLVRLVTPPGGVVLDPFIGSGSTLIAAAKEGFDSVGIDKEAAYVEISRKRIAGELGMLCEVEVK